MISNYDMDPWEAQTIVSLVERGTPSRVFTIWRDEGTLQSIQQDMTSWRNPSLALIRGTILGAADFSTFYGGSLGRMRVQDGRFAPVPREEWRTMRAAQKVSSR